MPDTRLDQARSHHEAGRLAEAERLYAGVLESEPGNPVALHLAGVAALQQGRLEPASQRIEAALAAKPDYAEAWGNLGIVLGKLGRLAEAIAAQRRAIELVPGFAEAHYNLGNALRGAGERAAAEDCYRRAIALRPNYPAAHLNLGVALEEAGRLAEATAAYRRVIALQPSHATAHVRVGNALFAAGDASEAVTALNRAIALDPTLYEAHSNLAIFLRAQRRLDEAEAACRRAIALKPEAMTAHSTLGGVLIEAGRAEEGIAAWRSALAIKPDAEILYALGSHLAGARRKDEAIACFDRAVAVRPDDVRSLSASTHQRRHLCRWDGLAEDEARVLARLRQGKGRVSPFELLATDATLEDQLLAAAAFVRPMTLAPELQFQHGPAQAKERLRLGYLSADFHEHATAHLTAELFERHDRARFEVIGYSTMPGDGSAMRARLERGFDRFVDLAATGDDAAARRIHDDGVDILIDLKGHTEGARLPILARRPAPLQVSFLGYPGTMGADFIDYAIVDRHVARPEEQAFFRERLVHLPDSYQPNDRQRRIAETAPPQAETGREEAGLPDRGIVFCCFNNSYKITAEIFSIWMRLLAAVPGSVLWLLEANPAVRDNLAREAVLRGVLPDRLVWAPRLPPARHLARHRLADLFLDTRPYNAHTTASDALWAGLPVLTCPGATFAGRVAASLLHAAGLPELVAPSLADYEALALRLASDPASLAALKAKLAANRLTTPLFDSARFTRHLEAAYRRMWEMRQAGEAATGFEVAAE
jgi:predicted O-linked N-acetylglucosamine transferase (SPINDLY family)